MECNSLSMGLVFLLGVVFGLLSMWNRNRNLKNQKENNE